MTKIKELTPDQESAVEKNIVWVFGAVRGGTTWLGSQLLSHQTKTLFEPKIARVLGDRRMWVLKDGKNIDRQSAHDDYIFSNKFKGVWLHFLRKLIINRVYSQFPYFTFRIVMKEPLGLGGSDIISNCLPKSKIIILVRDGRDVVDSRLDAIRDKNSWGVKREGNKPLSKKQRMSFIKENSGQWVVLMEDLMRAYNNHNKNLRIMVKYEKLRNNTRLELKKIYEFLEIDIKKNELEKIVTKHSYENISAESKGIGKFVRFASPGKWKENFNKEEKELMNSIMGTTLAKLNYEV